MRAPGLTPSLGIASKNTTESFPNEESQPTKHVNPFFVDEPGFEPERSKPSFLLWLLFC